MQAQKNAIHKALLADPGLLSMLAKNTPYWDEKKGAATDYSIIPAGAASGRILTPFVTIQGGAETRIGSKMTTETVYLRVYDKRPKFFVTIDQIMEKMKSILDGAELEFGSERFVRIQYESSLAELEDPGLDMHFREAVFLLTYL